MKLFHSATSPYVRKVVVLALETGQSFEKLPASASPIQRDPSLCAQNPLGKIPAAITPEGEVLYDSRVITRWLDSRHSGAKMYPEGDAVFGVLRREALADGLLDAALLARYESMVRPEPLRWSDWLQGQMDKIAAAADQMERDASGYSGIDAGLIATGCALGYLDFRFDDFAWRATRPTLAAWFETFDARPSMASTRPT